MRVRIDIGLLILAMLGMGFAAYSKDLIETMWAASFAIAQLRILSFYKHIAVIDHHMRHLLKVLSDLKSR